MPNKPFAAGDKLPSFTAQATDNTVIDAEALKGRNTVLYFYPRDDTPGCTQESKAFAEHYESFAKHDTAVIGISRDSLASHEKFKAKYDLTFPLIADPEETLCNLFDVMRDKNMYGKKVRGIERSTFLIDKTGVIRQVWRKVKVPGHVEEVLAAVAAL